MGAQMGKAEMDLLEEITNARAQLAFGTITLSQAQVVLDNALEKIRKREVSFSGDANDDVQSKLQILKEKIIELDNIEREKIRKEMQAQQADDAKRQLAKGQEKGTLVPIYSREYGDGAVAALLEEGGRNGGYRYPREGQKLAPIAAEVHRLACKDFGVSSHNSISNGLVNRVREQSMIVVEYAYKAGYPVENDDVQYAMAELAKQIAFTRPSDSGDREYTKDNMPRGMSYNMDTRVPGPDPALLKGGFSEDPAVQLESHRLAVIKLEVALSKADGARERALRKELERIRGLIKELERRV